MTALLIATSFAAGVLIGLLFYRLVPHAAHLHRLTRRGPRSSIDLKNRNPQP